MNTPDATIEVLLDRKRAIRWTKRAEARNSSLARPASFAHLGNRQRRLYTVCALLWAALVDRDADFAEPEDLAEYLTTEEQQVEAFKALRLMVEQAFPQKKTPPSAAPSVNGQEPSSSSASSPDSTGGT